MEILIMNTNQHTLHEPKLLIEIESFTKRIIDNGLKRKDLPELIRLLDGFELIYSCNHSYTDYAGLFEFLANNSFYTFQQMRDGRYTYISLLEIDDRLLEYFCMQFQVHKPKVLSDLRQYKCRVKNRLERLRILTEGLFEHYSRILVVRVDLKYRTCNQHLVNIEMFYEHVQMLCSRMANKNKCFENLQAYAWCLEQAPLGGYHVHLYLIYNGSKCTYDAKLARWVGRIWMDEITEGHGSYWNCHTGKGADEDQDDGTEVGDRINIEEKSNKYLNGLGMIVRVDPRGKERLAAVYGYLARITDEKLEQRLRVKIKGMRTFGCSLSA